MTGHGTIDGREVFVFSQDFTVIGGSLGEAHSQKISKVMDHAVRVGSPIIGLNDSGGARIQEGVDALAAYGEIFHRNVEASGVVPQISCIMGPCAGGAVYSPAMTDFTFMVENSSNMFVTGPNVVKTVIHQDISSEELGGAQVHGTVSGVAHFVIPNDILCLREVRRLINFLPSNNRLKAPFLDLRDPPERTDPALDYLIPPNPNQTYDMNVLIYSILDGAEFLEIQRRFRPEHHLRIWPDGRANHRPGGQSARGPGGRSGQQCLHQGCPVRQVLRRIQHSADLSGGCSRIHAGSGAGTRGDHPARRQTPVRLYRSHRAADHGHCEESLRRRVSRDELQAHSLRYQLCLANGRDCRPGAPRARWKSFTARKSRNPKIRMPP